MTTLTRDQNTGGFALPSTVNPDITSTSYNPATKALTFGFPDTPKYQNLFPASSPVSTSKPMSVSDLLTKILQDSQKNNGNQYTGNNTALLAGKEAMQGTNAGVYSNDLANANITNEARLSLLNNDQNLQQPGLKSITDQQQMNEAHYKATNEAIKNTQDAYDKEQDRITKAKEAAAKLAQDTKSNIIHQASAFEMIKSAPYLHGDGTFKSDNDGYVDPKVWSQARINWEANSGGTDASFLSNFKKYLNPADYKVAGLKGGRVLRK